ncbi:MAG TPA: hypothetical protein VH643_21195 [Gemmataceae bacterium]|jgi:hypothetical protein
MNPTSTPPDAFAQWHTEITALFDTLETASSRIRSLRPPPTSDDAAGRVDALASLWLRCRFTPPAPDAQAPWEGAASVLAHHLARAPEDLLRAIYADTGAALVEALGGGGTDTQRRLIATEGLPHFTFRVSGPARRAPRERFYTESLNPNEPPEIVWAAVELSRLPIDHPLRMTIADGWRNTNAGLPCAVLGPTVSGRPAPLLAVAAVARWTEDMRAPQRWEEMERERRRRADEAERERFEAATERGRLGRIEKELAAMRTKQPV